MPIRVTCACGKQYTFRDEFAWRRAKCPACGLGVNIPGPQDNAATTKSAPAAPQKPVPQVEPSSEGENKTLLYAGLGVSALILVVGIGIVIYFLFFRTPPQLITTQTLPPATSTAPKPQPASTPSVPSTDPSPILQKSWSGCQRKC